jgi:hypothetical protein
MMEPLLAALIGGLKLAGKLILIIVPLVTVFEVLRHLPVFRKAGNIVEPVMRGVGLTRDAAVPLFTGIFLGLAYGAGIIIRVAQRKNLPGRELFLMGLFLATCHSVVEDILIFVVVGGNGPAILGVRLGLAILLTGLMARVWKRAPAQGPSSP